jgi:hypothetical protein
VEEKVFWNPLTDTRKDSGKLIIDGQAEHTAK